MDSRLRGNDQGAGMTSLGGTRPLGFGFNGGLLTFLSLERIHLPGMMRPGAGECRLDNMSYFIAGCTHVCAAASAEQSTGEMLELIEVGVINRRDVKRDELRNHEAPDHRESQGAARFRAGAESHGDGQRTH